MFFESIFENMNLVKIHKIQISVQILTEIQQINKIQKNIHFDNNFFSNDFDIFN